MQEALNPKRASSVLVIMNFTISSVVGVAALLLLAACGGSSGSSAQVESTPTSQTGSGVKLTAQSVPQLGKILVDASGKTVYAAEQESSGQVECTGSCATVWLPVTLPSGTKPVAGPGVTAHLATIPRSNGEAQVTADGAPLYTFSLDASRGAANGNGVTDSFNGTDFSWHAVAPSGSDVQATSTVSPSPSDSASSGGYRY